MKQQSLFRNKRSFEFGGSLLRTGRRKTMRPLATKAPVHLVLKAQNNLLLFRIRNPIEGQFKKLNARFGITQYSLAVQGDHIHAVIRIPSRRLYRGWIRALTGTMARKFKGLKFRLRPWTRILTWGTPFRNVLTYVRHNQSEADLLLKAWEALEGFARWEQASRGFAQSEVH